MNDHIIRIWQEWQFDENSRHGVLVIETDLETNPLESGYDEQKISNLIDWVLNTEQAKSLRSATRFRIVPCMERDP